MILEIFIFAGIRHPEELSLRYPLEQSHLKQNYQNLKEAKRIKSPPDTNTFIAATRGSSNSLDRSNGQCPATPPPPRSLSATPVASQQVSGIMVLVYCPVKVLYHSCIFYTGSHVKVPGWLEFKNSKRSTINSTLILPASKWFYVFVALVLFIILCKPYVPLRKSIKTYSIDQLNSRAASTIFFLFSLVYLFTPNPVIYNWFYFSTPNRSENFVILLTQCCNWSASVLRLKLFT